jgi:predicted regulator of Ras-like GTPase activity (Roadblock/LC7/MglB family)
MMQIATVRSHEIWLRGTPLFCLAVAGSALTPALALDYLGELSTDIEAVVVIDNDGRVAAASGDDDDRAERMRELFVALLDRAADAAPDAGIDQLEVTTAEGSVFAVRGRKWTVGVVAGRKPLSSLMFYDLRNVVSDLGDGAPSPEGES